MVLILTNWQTVVKSAKLEKCSSFLRFSIAMLIYKIKNRDADDSANTSKKEVKHGVVDAMLDELLHILAEKLIAAKFEELP